MYGMWQYRTDIDLDADEYDDTAEQDADDARYEARYGGDD